VDGRKAANHIFEEAQPAAKTSVAASIAAFNGNCHFRILSDIRMAIDAGDVADSAEVPLRSQCREHSTYYHHLSLNDRTRMVGHR
jgi:hypothetical protein